MWIILGLGSLIVYSAGGLIAWLEVMFKGSPNWLQRVFVTIVCGPFAWVAGVIVAPCVFVAIAIYEFLGNKEQADP